MIRQNTPADRAIFAFGGVGELSDATGIPAKNIYRWRQARKKGGRDGRIPDDAQGLILAAARRDGIKLSAADLIDLAPVAGAAR